MPVAMIAEWTRGGPDTALYDEVQRRLGIAHDPPPGLIVHTSGMTEDGGFRVYEVWETQDAWEAFRDGPLAVTVAEVHAGLSPEGAAAAERPTESVYELHRLIRAEPAVGRR